MPAPPDADAAPRILGRRDTPLALARDLARATLDGLSRGELAVLDPSCGAGPLLLGAALEAKPGKAPRDLVLAGLDKDPAAVAEARAALGSAGLEARLAVADALDREPAELLALLGRPQRFDAVLANPPWVSFSGREAVGLSRAERARLRARFASFGRWPQLQGPFLERSLDLVRPLGRLGFVLPRQALDLEGYGPLRRAATARARILEVRDRGEGVFAGVCEPTATVVLERLAESATDAGSDAVWPDSADPRGPRLPRWAARALERLARFPRFPRALVSDPGVHTGNAAARILRDEPGEGLLPCREGKDVRPFALAPARRFVVASPRLAPPLYARVAPRERFLEAHVLVRQTADRPIAARHVDPGPFRNSALAVRAPGGLEVEVVVALLNSRLFALDHRARTADARQRAFPQVKVGALAALPFPAAIERATRARLATLVRAREGERDGPVAAKLDGMLEREVGALFGIDADAGRALAAWRP